MQEGSEDSDDINFTYPTDFKLRECNSEASEEAVESSGSRSAVPQTGSSVTTVLISQTQDDLCNLPVFSESKLGFILFSQIVIKAYFAF